MDPNATNQGAPPPAPTPEPDLGQTRYFPPQEGYRAQEAPPQPPTQSVYPQQPAPMPVGSPYGMYAGHRDRDRTVLALLLIGGGILFLLAQLDIPAFPGLGDLILLLLGGIFLYAYLSTRPGYRVGFLIPGCILLGLGVGQVLSNYSFGRMWDGGDLTTLTLGLGFCLIWVFERRHWWALIPGGILVLTGLSSGALGNLWPLALVAVGVYLLYEQTRRRPVR